MRTTTVGIILVLTVGVIIAVGFSTASGLDSTQQPSFLDVDTAESADSHSQSVTADLGLAADATDATLRAAYEQRTLAMDLNNASATDREALVHDYLEHLDDELQTLIAEDLSSVSALESGELTPRQLIQQAAETGYIASARQQTLDDLAALDGMTPETDLPRQAAMLELRYDLIAGHSRDRIITAATSPDRQTSIGIEASSAGLALSSVDATRYHREVIRYDRFTDAADTVGSLSSAEDIVVDAYPTSQATTATRDLGEGLYFIERTIPDGFVSVYVDGGSAAVAAERQQRWLDQLDIEQVASVTEDGIEVNVERSVSGGPLRVTAVDSDTGEPIDGSIYLRHGGTWSTLGPLDDGVTWGPDPGGAIDIRLVTADETVTISVDR